MGYSQTPTTSIQKTKLNGENAFIANEVVMDSLMGTHFKYVSLVSDHNVSLLEARKLKIDYDETVFKLDHCIETNTNFEFKVEKLEKLMVIQDNSHENDLDFWKKKAKKKWEFFLYGTALGAIIIAVIAFI